MDDDIVTFGHYPQTAKGNDNTPIQWIVLEIRNGKAMLISKYGLDCQPYHKTKKKINWEKCSLRAWLNKDFLKKAFTKEEQAAILITEVDNGEKQKITKDRVFLLSRKEAEAHFHPQRSGGPFAGGASVAPTDYAITKRKAYTDKFYRMQEEGKVAGWWWLRSTGSEQNYTGSIPADGSIHDTSVEYKTLAVRPVLWVDLNNEIFSEYVNDSGNELSDESFEKWFDEGAGRLLPKLLLQSGEEPVMEFFVNDDRKCDVRVHNASAEDFQAYVSLLKSYYRTIHESDKGIEVRTPGGYEITATYENGTERFIEVYIWPPNEM